MAERPPQMLNLSPFARLVGLVLPEDRDNGCILSIDEKVLNFNGTVHGGVPYTLADVSMGRALSHHLADDERIATVEMKVNYFVAVSSGTLVAEGKLIHKSRRLAVLESEVTCEGRLIAKAVGTFYISKKPKPKPD